MSAQDTTVTSVNSVSNQSDSPSVSSQVIAAIKNAATRTGVDFSYLLQKASQESSLNPTAKASTSSATGLFQFTNQTWLQMIKQNGAAYGLAHEAAQITTDQSGRLTVSDPVARQAILSLRNNPQISADMAAELDKENAASLRQNVGGKVGGTELYLAHFLGAGGASDFLNQMRSNPNITGASVLPDAASANASVFYTSFGAPRTLQQIYQHFAQKFDDRSATQIASAETPVSNPTSYHATSSVSLAANIANLMPTSYSVPSSDTSASFRTASLNLASGKGATTLLSAILLGQMNGASVDTDPSLATLSSLSGKKHNNLSILAYAA